MKKSLAGALVVVASLFAYQNPADAQETWTGQIGDSMCGAKHKPMGT